MEDFPMEANLIDIEVVSDLAAILDEATRTELLQSFARDASTLIANMAKANESELPGVRHALLGVTSMIGASALHDLVAGRQARFDDLTACLDRTVDALTRALVSIPAQKSDQ